MGHDLFLKALRGENHTGRPPVWLMRQAGRYMASYQKLRKQYSFLELCHTPRLIQHVTTLPIDTFGFDAAILFSDILLLLEAMGFTLSYEDGKAPTVTPRLSFRDSVQGDHILERLAYQFEGIQLAKKSLDRPLIGFSAAPFTLAGYLVEGGTKKWMDESPQRFEELLTSLADIIISYCNEQITSGCDAIQIFESAALPLTAEQFRQFCMPSLRKIVEGVRAAPLILFARGPFWESMAHLEPTALSLDWQCSLAEVRKKIPRPIALQGNFDPHLLLDEPLEIEQAVKTLLESMRNDPGYMCNLGHGILPGTPEKNVHVLVNTVREFS
jgi:uroporphyrinogen decarboxylase